MAEAADLPLRCRCGAVRGVARAVSPVKVNHCFCYCDDCQAFVHFLGRAGDIFDEHGGTEITQMSQASVAFTAGTDRIAAVKLTPKGLMRWYASCCGTPIRGPEETPDRLMALKFYTLGSAWFSFDDDVRGSLEVGKLADLAVLSDDYLTVPLGEIGNLESVLTLLGGKVVYAAGDFAALEN